jgi:alpha-glucuronidase
MENCAVWLGKKIGFVGVMACAALFVAGTAVSKQTADQAWLKYRGPGGRSISPLKVRALGKSPLEASAAQELQRGITSLSNASLLWRGSALNGQTIVGTVDEVRQAFPDLPVPHDLKPEGYWLYWSGSIKELDGDKSRLVVAGADERGVLYGAFALLRRIATANKIFEANVQEQPAMPIRWVDQWDNPDGSITRGYGGRSIFFEGGNVRED